MSGWLALLCSMTRPCPITAPCPTWSLENHQTIMKGVILMQSYYTPCLLQLNNFILSTLYTLKDSKSLNGLISLLLWHCQHIHDNIHTNKVSPNGAHNVTNYKKHLEKSRWQRNIHKQDITIYVIYIQLHLIKQLIFSMITPIEDKFSSAVMKLFEKETKLFIYT